MKNDNHTSKLAFCWCVKCPPSSMIRSNGITKLISVMGFIDFARSVGITVVDFAPYCLQISATIFRLNIFLPERTILFPEEKNSLSEAPIGDDAPKTRMLSME